MAEPPNLDELARRFLDLWQQQLSAWAADPDLARHMGALMALASARGFGAAEPSPGPTPPQSDGRRGPQAGAAAAGAAFGGGGGDLDKLAKRLAAVERRLAKLESGPGGGGRKPRPPSRKRQA